MTPDDAASTATDLSGVRVAVIGAGNMGGPVVRAALAAGVRGENVQVANSSRDSSTRAAGELGVTAADSHRSALAGADIVVLGVKPYQVLDLIARIRGDVPEKAVVVSLAAGITIDAIEQALPAGQPVVRAMPNTPVSVAEGVVGLMRGSSVDDDAHTLVHALFARAGIAVDITEDQVHAFIGAAGSMPGFVFAILEAMSEEAVRQGLRRDLADALVQQTVRGAATMLLEGGTHPAIARNRVSSPGGTTVEGLAALERAGMRSGIAAAMAAAAERSRAMTGG